MYARRAQKSGQNATRNRPQKAAKRNRVRTCNVDAGDVSRVSGGPREPIYLLKPRPFEPTHRIVYARHAQKSGCNATRNRPQKAAKKGSRIYAQRRRRRRRPHGSGGLRKPIYLVEPRPFEPTRRNVYARRAQKAARMPLGTARRRLRKGIAFIRATSTPETSHACREVPGSPYTF